METRKIFKCFISSPGDCNDERQCCQEVIETVNNGLAKHLRVSFDLFMWEYDVLPDMGKNGQEIIDQYVAKSNYDIFIGIMKNRFGHATKKAGSGTEHEYSDALERKFLQQNSLPRILFFFGKENVDPENFDFEQFKKVKEFKSKISDNGLYIDFADMSTFKSNLNDKLELFIKEYSPFDQPTEKIREVDIVLKKLENDLSNSLKIYNENSPVWIEPIISSKKSIPNNPSKNEDNRKNIKDIIDNPFDIVIKAPSEFGLTSLAHYIKLEAWKLGKKFIYVDSQQTRKHKIIKDINKAAEDYFLKDAAQVDCILLDSVCFEQNGIMQIVKNVCEEFPNVPLIIFNTLDNKFFIKSNEDDKVEIKRTFTSFYLLPLPQNEVRKIVTSYSKLKCLEDDNDVILTKVTKDLEILNLHRTAKNCISILRASSKIGKEYTAVNRTKLLETILNTIFEEYDIPTYRDKKPDIKDCSFVLGYFCELLVKRKNFDFNETFFKSELQTFCEKNYIELDLNYLLRILIDNSILSISGIELHFKNSYWAFYFLAQRMNMSKDFTKYIYDNKCYIDYPEIIEFYTGIDRNKEDALKILGQDLDETLTEVRRKVNIPDNINPFKAISWQPDILALEKEQAKISENVISSGLPDEIKDRYDDKHYDQQKPYNQVINSVMRNYSFLVLMRQISAASRALRNSDFVDAVTKKTLLEKITQSWNELNKLLIILSPLLADRGNIAFEGAAFYLAEDEWNIDDPKEKRLAVLLALPGNVVRLFKDDLFSSKMGPLLIDKAESESNSLLKHELMLVIVNDRPKGWHKVIDKYIVSLDKNSFFLCDMFETLDFIKDYRSAEIEDRRAIDLLGQKCRAKHLFKNNNPDLGLINRARNIK